MPKQDRIEISYFPGCSLATTAKENNRSLIRFCQSFDMNLIEVEDWNCCGSSSAHSIDSNLAFHLASRNLSLAPPGRPLLVACPACFLRLRGTQLHLKEDPKSQLEYKNTWKRPFDPQLQVIHFFELLESMANSGLFKRLGRGLNGLKYVPYYGCMLARPPEMRHEKNFFGLMEKVLSSLGGTALSWPYMSRCCGTFLTVSRPEIVTPIINTIINGAIEAGADCIITACAMCHLNLEVRSTNGHRIPILHFSEALSLTLGTDEHADWFSRHLVDPRPVLKSRSII